jgi:septal ring factor EnvC (AmiA/AmiB activator)
MKKQIEELSKKTRSQEQEIASLRKNINSKNVEIHRIQEVMKKSRAANTTLPAPSASATKKVKDAALKTTVEEPQWFPKWGPKRKGKLLAEVFWDVMDGVAQNALMALAKNRLRSTVFHPFNVLRAMDFACGTLYYEGI